MAKLIPLRCRACGTKYDVVEHRGEVAGVADGAPGAACPACGALDPTAVVAIPMPVGLNKAVGSDTGYPYYDRGLGMWLESSSHRNEVCRNPRAYGINASELVPLEGKATDAIVNLTRADTRARAARYARRAAHAQDLEESPAFADYRRLRDKGFFDYVAKEEAAKAQAEAASAHKGLVTEATEAHIEAVSRAAVEGL